MQSLVDSPPISWGLSGRAQAVYGWIAAFCAFAIPWSDMALLPYDVQFTRPLVALAVLSWLLSWRADSRVRRMGFPLWAMLFFLLLAPAHFLTADDPARTGRRLTSYLGLFLMALFFQQAIRTGRTYRLVLGCYIAGCSVSLGGLALNLLRGVTMGDGRYTAPSYDPNDLAGQVALSIPVAAYLGFRLKRGAIWFRLYLPIAVAGILLTASRAGLVVLALVCVYPAMGLLRKARRGKLGILTSVVVTGCAVYYLSPNISYHRLQTMYDEISRGDMNGRGAIWINGMRLFWEHPVLGIGAGAFAGSASGRFSSAAHNTYLEVLVEHGIAGFSGFLLIVLGLAVRAARFPPDERLLWWVVLGSWMVLVFTLSWENREYTWLMWGLCASFVAPSAKTHAT